MLKLLWILAIVLVAVNGIPVENTTQKDVSSVPPVIVNFGSQEPVRISDLIRPASDEIPNNDESDDFATDEPPAEAGGKGENESLEGSETIFYGVGVPFYPRFYGGYGGFGGYGGYGGWGYGGYGRWGRGYYGGWRRPYRVLWPYG